MSRHFAISPNSLEAIHAAVQRAMDGEGRVGADELAPALAEHEPERHRHAPREMSDAEYARSFEVRFGPSFAEGDGDGDGDEGDEYAVEFSRRFGFEATA